MRDAITYRAPRRPDAVVQAVRAGGICEKCRAYQRTGRCHQLPPALPLRRFAWPGAMLKGLMAILSLIMV